MPGQLIQSAACYKRVHGILQVLFDSWAGRFQETELGGSTCISTCISSAAGPPFKQLGPHSQGRNVKDRACAEEFSNILRKCSEAVLRPQGCHAESNTTKYYPDTGPERLAE